MQELIDRISTLLASANRDNLGDILLECFRLLEAGPRNPENVTSEELIQLEQTMRYAYELAGRVDLGWKLFATVDKPISSLADEQCIQLFTISAALREAAFCFAGLTKAAQTSPYGTTAIRFFINGLCSNVAAWFLLDWKDNRKAGFSQAGSIIRVLEPLGLGHLLDPIYRILSQPLGNLKLREAIIQIRNEAIVHTNFLPDGIKRLYTHSELHKLKNKFLWNALLNELGNEILILQLKLMAIIDASGKNLEQTLRAYMGDLLGPDFDISPDGNLAKLFSSN